VYTTTSNFAEGIFVGLLNKLQYQEAFLQ